MAAVEWETFHEQSRPRLHLADEEEEEEEEEVEEEESSSSSSHSYLFWVEKGHVSVFPPRVLRGFVHPGKIPAHLRWMQEHDFYA